jgi:hypothetical protein
MNPEFCILCSIEHGRAANCFIHQECQNPSTKWRYVCTYYISLQNVFKFRLYGCPKLLMCYKQACCTITIEANLKLLRKFSFITLLLLLLLLWPLTVKVKQSLHNPAEALRVPRGWGSEKARRSSHKGGKVVSSRQRPPLPHRKHSWYSFSYRLRPEGLCQWQIPMTTSGIEAMAFRLVAQCLNQLLYRVPRTLTVQSVKWAGAGWQ